MKLILIKNNTSAPKSLNLSKGLVASACVCVAVLFSVLVYLGVVIGKPSAEMVERFELVSEQGLAVAIQEEKKKIQETQKYIDNNLVALSARLGGLQAQVSRINAVGKRLAVAADVDMSVFDYSEEPAQGGDGSISLEVNEQSLLEEISSMESVLAQREVAIQGLAVSLSELVLKENQTPEGMPVRKSWVSSPYGWRASPISGEKRFHKGVDVPGKTGAPVLAVADGVVIRSERNSVFGHVVEINHGEGLVTLYAHNSRNIASVGDSVTKGDKIAEVGSTGRSTGPHVHFEVHKNGRVINPRPFLR